MMMSCKNNSLKITLGVALFLICWGATSEAFSFSAQRNYLSTRTSTTTRTTGKLSASSSSVAVTEMPQKMLVTFDLDDTLFPIEQVVEEANVAQINAMKELGYETTIEKCMEQTKAIRQALDGPVTYSDLRRAAIRAEMIRLAENSVSRDVLERHMQHVFDAWLQERHDASERHLFEDAIPALVELKSKFPSIQIGAITNGRGNPLDMKNTLAPLFDFCVSGEDAAVFPHRKPNSKIYQVALTRWREQKSDDETMCWFHVGDCLANDVGASSDLGAHAIWVVKEDPKEQPFYSTASLEELSARAKLIDAAREKMSGQIKSLKELNTVLQNIIYNTNWQEKIPGMDPEATAA